jgi:hypothetical protein
MLDPGELSLALVLTALLAVSCSDPQAGTLPSTSPSPHPTTASPTPSPTSRQDEVRGAIREYFATLNKALKTPTTGVDALEEKISPTCPCIEIVEVLRRLARDGEYLDYTYSVRDIRIQQVGDLGASVTYVVDQTAGSKRKSDGRVVDSYPATSARYSAHLAHKGANWLLDRVDRQK